LLSPTYPQQILELMLKRSARGSSCSPQQHHTCNKFWS
jgi:hypothetical protein